MATFDDIQLFPWQQEALDLMTETNAPLETLTVQQLQEAQASLEPPIPDANNNIVIQNGISMEYHEDLIEQMAELQALPDLVPFTSDEVVSAGMIYAPYVPLMQTPTLHISDLTSHISNLIEAGEEVFTIKKYDDIYSDPKERFENLDL
jgi:hypothetical protein